MTESTNSCVVPAADWSALDGGYDEVVERLSSDVVWVRFFGVRPCCPAPGFDKARSLVDELKSKIAEKDGLSDSERQSLYDIADTRLEWYSSRFCRR